MIVIVNLYILPLRMKCTYIVVPDLRMIRRRLQRRINMVIVCNHNLHVHTFCTTLSIIDKRRSDYVFTSNRWQVARIIIGTGTRSQEFLLLVRTAIECRIIVSKGTRNFKFYSFAAAYIYREFHNTVKYSVATLRQNRTIKIYVIVDKKYVRAMITLQL